jgi:hypothetical protein
VIPASDAFRLALARGGALRYRYSLKIAELAGSVWTTTRLGDLHVIEQPSLRIDGSSASMRSLSLTVATQQTVMRPLETPGSYTLSGTPTPYGDPDGVRFYADPKRMEQVLSKAAHVEVYARVRDESGVWLEQLIAKLRVIDYLFSLSDGTVQIDLEDFTSSLEQAQIVAPWAPVTGTTPLSVRGAISALINDAFPTGFCTAVGVGIEMPNIITGWGIDLTKAGTAFTGSRVDAVNELALLYGYTLRCSYSGTFALVQAADLNPEWAYALGSSYDAEVIDDTYQGVMVDYETSPRGDGGFNAVTITWASASGDTYGTVFLVDNDPASPIYYGGPYGRRHRPPESVDSVADEAVAISIAETRLAQSQRRSRRASLTIPANPLLLPDDSLLVRFPRPDGGIGVETHEIDSIDMTLGEAVMRVETTVLPT